MNKSIEVFGTYGTLTVDTADGLVTDYEPSASGDDYKIIKKVNLSEWRTHYYAEPFGRIDILDLGYWTDEGRYEPPTADWRKLQVELQAEDEAYRRRFADLCGPMGRVLP
jgi:hypothetical protein